MHNLNLFVHISAGTLALLAGSVSMFTRKGSRLHRLSGKTFLILLSVVVTTGFFGFFLFRSNPFLLMLTMLSGYVGYAGWRNLILKEEEGNMLDAMIAAVTLVGGCSYTYWLRENPDNDFNPSVIYPTVGALVLVTIYDLLKYFFLHSYLKRLWLYEHIYKTTSAFSAILSAFVGTVLPDFKPYSQIGPSTLMLSVIVFYITKEAMKRKRITTRKLQAVIREI
jgi:uncharacterized membrane protein